MERSPVRGRCTPALLIALAIMAGCQKRQAEDSIVQVTIPAGTAELERIPSDAREVFELPANAGQTLLIELNPPGPTCAWDGFDKEDTLQVFRTGSAKPTELPSQLDREYYPGDWMSAIPRNGSYRIIVNRPSRRRYALRITLMGPHDPRLDPGIVPSQVSMSGALLPPGNALTTVPFQPPIFCEESPQVWPAALEEVDGNGFFAIMLVDGLKRNLREDPDRLRRVERLESDLRSATAPRDPPWLGWSNAGLVNWGRLGSITGDSWRALRWIGSYAQDNLPLTNPLGYTVEAITDDGRYLILMYREIQYLNPPANISQLSAQQIQDLDDPKVFRTFQRKVDASLTNARPESFQPPVDQLDAAIRSIEFH